MRLVLQCAMCGTHHPVGTAVCSTCRATGVTQLRLMFECPTCGRLGLNPACATCPPAVAVVPLDLDEELVVAEELPDDQLTLGDADEDGHRHQRVRGHAASMRAIRNNAHVRDLLLDQPPLRSRRPLAERRQSCSRRYYVSTFRGFRVGARFAVLLASNDVSTF